MRLTIGLLTVAVVATATWLAWPGPSRDQTPARFLAGVIRLLAANRYQEAWQTLDPADQSLAPRAVYVACESRSLIPGRLASLQTRQIGRDRIGVAVAFALEFVGDPVPGGVHVNLTAHAVPTKHGWAWVLPPARRALYRHGCGVTAGPPA